MKQVLIIFVEEKIERPDVGVHMKFTFLLSIDTESGSRAIP